jgi:hypothetical protein
MHTTRLRFAWKIWPNSTRGFPLAAREYDEETRIRTISVRRVFERRTKRLRRARRRRTGPLSFEFSRVMGSSNAPIV